MEEGIAFVYCMKYRHNQGKYFPGANYYLSKEANYYMMSLYISSGALPGTLFTKLSTATTL